MKNKPRSLKYDILRVAAMFLVIAVHSNPKPFSETSLTAYTFYTITYMCNGLFYMLSGALNLNKTFEEPEDYFIYYRNKVASILFPFLVGSMLLSIYKYEGEFRLIWMINSILRDFLSGHTGTYLWFMYPLIGMILSTPFLSKMLHSMKDWELHILFSLGMLWQIFSVYLSSDLGISFGYSGWLLSSWCFHYFLGFYIRRILTPKNKPRFYMFAIPGFVITVLCCYFFNDSYKTPYSLAPAHILLVMGTFVFLTNEITIKNTFAQKLLLTLSTHSFTVYILHHIVKKEVEKFLTGFSSPLWKYCLHFTLTFCFSFLLAFALNKLVFFPLQKKIPKITINF